MCMGVEVKKIIFYFIFCSAIVVAYMVGSLNSSEEGSAPLLSQQQQGVTQRVEHYQPSCEQLTQLGQSPWQTSGDDSFTVYTTVDNFYVFGVNFSAQSPPITHWWGGDRHAAMLDCREK